MQGTFPEDYELLAFFGVEPKVLDPKAPWIYNKLDFEVVQDGFVLQCQLAPADRELTVHLSKAGTELMRLAFTSFTSLHLATTAEAEELVATFERGQAMEIFRLMLKPRLWFGFGELPMQSSRYSP